jgi:glycosyltransferase family protein
MSVLRYGKFFSAPRQVAKRILSQLYPLIIRIWPLPKVLSIPETLRLLNETDHSIIRFGDSEFLYICDKLSLPYQKYQTELADKMKAVLKSTNPSIMVGLPSGYHSLNNLSAKGQRFWRSQITWIYPRLRKHLLLDKQYVNASVTRIYVEYEDKSHCKEWFESFMNIWRGKKIVIIEGEKSRMGLGNNLFQGATSIERVLAPSHHAFSKFQELLHFSQTIDKSKLILLSLGPCAKALGFELALQGYRVLDVGNLDIEYEWYLRGAKEKVKIPGKYTSEAKGGRIVEDVHDEVYQKQIIKEIR